MQTTTESILNQLRSQGIRPTIENLTDEQSMELTERYGAHNYHPLPINVVRAEGVFAWDHAGNQYIDCIGCYSAVSHGHLSPRVVEAVREQLNVLTLTGRAVYTPEMAVLMQALCEYTGLEMACPMNTGAEAVETALKLARKWAYTVKGVPKDQAEIIVAQDNFHGRTITIVSFSTEPQYQDGFGPFTPGFQVVPFGDLSAVEKAITPNTAAVLMEPIQAEGGIIIPPDGFMSGLRELCTRENVLLIWDEIQTGFGRTGKRFAWQYEEAKPDMITLGKALGGGVFPVSAVVGRREVMEVFQPGDHGSTFGGNPLGSVVALAAILDMEERNLTERSAQLGERLMSGLRNLKHDCIEDVRGRGLLVGIEVKEGTDTAALADAFVRERIITKETRSRTFRYTPPLTIEPEQIDEIVARTDRALASL
ncbi:MAG: acetylornithine aminotransferase [Fimbriimonadales bacterium]|nr:MAG: acetylornithine aminotransferase [Fimbriimonadales bacterium]